MDLGNQLIQIWSASSYGMRLTIVFLFLLAGRLIVLSIKSWWILGFTSFMTRRRLKQIVRLVGHRDFASLKPLARTIRSRTPEAGLQQLDSIDAHAVSVDLESILDHADRQFRSIQDKAQLALANLSRWRNLIVWVLGANLFGQIADLMPEFLHRSGCDYGDCADGRPLIPFIISIGLWLIVALLIIQWHFSGRLRVRVAFWDQFVAEVKNAVPQRSKTSEAEIR